MSFGVSFRLCHDSLRALIDNLFPDQTWKQNFWWQNSENSANLINASELCRGNFTVEVVEETGEESFTSARPEQLYRISSFSALHVNVFSGWLMPLAVFAIVDVHIRKSRESEREFARADAHNCFSICRRRFCCDVHATQNCTIAQFAQLSTTNILINLEVDSLKQLHSRLGNWIEGPPIEFCNEISGFAARSDWLFHAAASPSTTNYFSLMFARKSRCLFAKQLNWELLGPKNSFSFWKINCFSWRFLRSRKSTKLSHGSVIE